MLSRREFFNGGLACLSNAHAFGRFPRDDGVKSETSITCIFDGDRLELGPILKFMSENGFKTLLTERHSSHAFYEDICSQMREPPPNSSVVLGITNYTAFVVMRAFARDHGLRLQGVEEIGARLGRSANKSIDGRLGRALEFMTDFEQIRARRDTHSSWVLTDCHLL